MISVLNITYLPIMKNSEFLIRRQRRNIDRFRIVFRCCKRPDASSQLIGFKADKVYIGRYYNGLYEISVDWGRGKPFLIEKKQFEQYFQLMDEGNNSFGT